MIHGQTVSHLFRRTLEANKPPWEVLRDEIPKWAAVPIFLTILIFAVVLISIRYTLMGVIATLAQVETPQSEYVPLAQGHKDDEDEETMLPASTGVPEMVVIPTRPITSSIRATIRHIHAIGGFTARWRGLSAAACTVVLHSILYQILFNLLALFLPYSLASVIGGVATTVALARWYMAWTHIVISEPSAKVWYRRVPTFKTWRNIWAPTAINAVASQFAFIAPAGVFLALGLSDPDRVRESSAVSAVCKLLLVFAVGIAVYIAIVLPSEVALTRCQASMLPDEDESIVAFDRSFGGKVVPAIVGGSGMISFIDAWKSFDRPALGRLIKLYAKIFAIDVALHLLFGLVLGLELWALLGPAIKRAFKDMPPPDGEHHVSF